MDSHTNLNVKIQDVANYIVQSKIFNKVEYFLFKLSIMKLITQILNNRSFSTSVDIHNRVV